MTRTIRARLIGLTRNPDHPRGAGRPARPAPGHRGQPDPRPRSQPAAGLDSPDLARRRHADPAPPGRARLAGLGVPDRDHHPRGALPPAPDADPSPAGPGAAPVRRPGTGRRRRPALRRRPCPAHPVRGRDRAGWRPRRPPAPHPPPPRGRRRPSAIRARRAPRAATTDRNRDGARTHTVTSGESLWSIAHTELGDGARWHEIADLNPGTHGPQWRIFAGTTLTLPTAHSAPDASRQGGATYTVRPGDTLSEIAKTSSETPTATPRSSRPPATPTRPTGGTCSDPDLILPGWQPDHPRHRRQRPLPRQLRWLRSCARSPASTGTRRRSHRNQARRRRSSDQPTDDEHPRDDHAAARSEHPRHGPAERCSGQRPRRLPPRRTTPTRRRGCSPAWPADPCWPGPCGCCCAAVARRRPATDTPDARSPPRPRSWPRWRRPSPPSGRPPKTLVDLVDRALRRLASHHAAANLPMPAVAAVEIGRHHLTLHLSSAADLPAPWSDQGNQTRWSLPADTDPADLGEMVPDQPAPYPLLVTIGTSDTGHVWLYNCEDLTITLTGDHTYGADFARYLAAEIACNPWSAGVTLHCVGVATEVAPINPDRIRSPHHRPRPCRRGPGRRRQHHRSRRRPPRRRRHRPRAPGRRRHLACPPAPGRRHHRTHPRPDPAAHPPGPAPRRHRHQRRPGRGRRTRP